MNFEDLKDLPPCTAIPLLMFLEDEHRDLVLGMTGIPRTLLIDFTSKVNRTLKVDTAEELQALIDNLLRRQLIFQCALHHERKEGSTLRVWNESFAVIINPWHPAIKEFLQPLLTEAMDLLNAGEKVCLKIKFGKSLKDWFRETIGDDLECKQGRTTQSGMGLYIYNYSTPVEVCSNPELIISCFPFWFLFGGSCYMERWNINKQRGLLQTMSDGFLGMTDDTKSRIKKTWTKFSEKQEDMYELGIPMFEKLFELKPETKKLFHFDETNPERWSKVKAHVKLLFDTMGFSISMIDDQAAVTPIIVDLGTRHFYYGVNQNYYLVFGECLVHAITVALGDSFTEEDKTAFMTFYHWIGGCIVKGMSMESYKK